MWHILPYQDEELKKAYDSVLMRKLWRYISPHKWFVIFSILLLPLITLFHLCQPYLIKIAIDDHIIKGVTEGLGVVALLYLGALLMELLARYAQAYLIQLTGQRVMTKLREDLFCKVQTLSMEFFSSNPAGKIMTRMTNDVEGLNELFASGLVSFIGDFFTLLGIVIAMLALNLQLSLITFSALPFLILAVSILRKRLREVFRLARQKIAKLNAFIQENLSGIQVIQVFLREQRNFEAFKRINREHRDINILSIRYEAFLFSSVELIGSISVALILWYGAYEIFRGFLTFGVLVAFIEYIRKFFVPITDLSAKYAILQSGMASLEKIFALLETKPKIMDPPKAKKLGRIKEGIAFEKVWFSYGNSDYVLKDISFHVKVGEKIGIVGITGAGKSTLIKLLLRFYDVARGHIFIDGMDIRELSLKDLRENIAFVPQEIFVFSENLEENISLGDERISQGMIKNIARLTGADAFIGRLSHGYREKIKERGMNLSAGQKQLIAIMRALAFGRSILLLDEPTSHMDSETENRVLKTLKDSLKDKTAIVVAHRLSTVMDMDRILVLHRGRLKEMGTHEELLALRGIYWHLYRLQFSRGEIETTSWSWA